MRADGVRVLLTRPQSDGSVSCCCCPTFNRRRCHGARAHGAHPSTVVCVDVREVEGDVFELVDALDAFAHGVNVAGVNVAGVMGAGVALQVRARWPEMFEPYRQLCRSGRLRPGMVWPCRDASGVMVYNLATQDAPGRHARLEWVGECVAKMAAHASATGLSAVATVRLGCGIGGLSWSEVLPVLRAVESPLVLHVASMSPRPD